MSPDAGWPWRAPGFFMFSSWRSGYPLQVSLDHAFASCCVVVFAAFSAKAGSGQNRFSAGHGR